MALYTQESLLVFVTLPYINRELRTQLAANDVSVKYIKNDQNSIAAFHLFSNNRYHNFNAYIYIQYSPNSSFSQIHFESVKTINGNIVLTLEVEDNPVDIQIANSAQVAVVFSMTAGKEFFNLPPGNILPIDYVLENPITNPNVLEDVLYLNNENILLVNDQALLVNISSEV